MMTVKLVCVGTLKEAYWRDACAEYEKRLSAFCKFKCVALPESTLSQEKDAILKECEGFTVALCVEGKPMTSEDLAEKIAAVSQISSKITFIIGSSCGLDEGVKKREDLRLSFSSFTFPHQMMRVILLEQIYRAFTIQRNMTYHK
ncbi:MAG: 23S rRNA (pseudouridine(1915)-N(3))-methyltransferase RlmH [Clostridia bacterium]|nr:23S rRNA (pseudouridine(1915)-N(3))-methyltransferase RlmH [Clostridia bacterium]